MARVPWRRVYTTNYDNTFEFSCLQAGTTWIPLLLDDAPTAAAKRCIHINGHLNNLTIQSISSQIKLTHSSYSSDSFANSPWSQQFRQDLNAAKSIFFVGYSLADIDITRIIYDFPNLRQRMHFIVGPSEDDITVSPLEEYGTVHRIGIQGFASLINSTVPPPDITSYEYTWLAQYDQAVLPTMPSDKAAIEVFTMGAIEPTNAAWSLGEPQPTFLITRTVISEIIKEIEQGRRWFLIHSDLGNGKTVLKHQLSYILSRDGYKVFWDSQFDLNRDSDLRQLTKETSKLALFIDEYPERFDVIDGLLTINVPNITVFVCVRTTLYELGETRYNQQMPGDYIPIDINDLSDQDVSAFVQVFNRLGMWGQKADVPDVDKANFIKVECSRHIARLILSVFEESDVGKRITNASKNIINKREDVSAVIILSFLLNRIGQVPRITLISEVMGKDAIRIVRSPEFKKAGEFIRFADGAIKARSSIISTYLLRKSLSAENLMWHVEAFERRLASLRRDSTLHHMFTQMQRFPVIESIIDSPRKREIIIGYFQAIKDLPYCTKSAQFWLHYAMARAAYGEFQEASIYFRSAQSLAKTSPKDSIDVNNQFAKMLIDSRTHSEEYGDYGEAFSLAHQILIEQMVRNTNRHFPFRQAARYAEFISYRRNRLSPSDLAKFITSCNQVIKAIDNLGGNISRSREVRQCREAMERSINIAKSG